MWLCKQCGYKNNNSSERCHGENCKALRNTEALELPTVLINEKKEMDKTVYDWCSVCAKDQFFSKIKRVRFRMMYRCHGCHKTFVKIGKNKPKPTEVFT